MPREVVAICIDCRVAPAWILTAEGLVCSACWLEKEKRKRPVKESKA